MVVERAGWVLFALGTMSAESSNIPAPSGSGRVDALRVTTLMGAATLDGLVRRHADETSRPALIALGLLATGAAVALAHITGTEVRAALGSGHSDFLPSLLSRAFARQDASLAP